MSEYDLGTARGRIELDSSGAVTGAATAEAAQKSLRGSTDKSTASLGLLAGGFLAISGAAAVGFGIAVKAAADFEKKLSEFKAVTGATEDQLEAIRQKALQLGRDTAFGAGEAAEAMVELGKLGLSTTAILEGAADATVALAAAGGIDLSEAATIAASAMNQFQLAAADLPRVADLLAGTANASASDVSQLGLALSYVGPVAKAAGLSIDDTALALGLLHNNGIRANKAGTALRGILSQLKPTSERSAEAMKELGLITANGSNLFFDAQGNVKSFSDIVSLLRTKFSKLTPEMQGYYSKLIFGTEQMAAVAAITGTTDEALAGLNETIQNTSAADVAEEKLNNLSGSLQILKGSIETALIGAGSQFQEGLKGIVDQLTNMVNWLANLDPELQKWIGYIVAGTAAITGLIGAGILLQKAIGTLRVAMMALNATFLANPVFLVIAAIVAVGAALYLLYQNVEPVRQAIDNLWQTVQPFFEKLRGWLIDAANWFAELGRKAWADLQPTFKQMYEWVHGTLIPKLQEIWTNVQPYLKEFRDWITGTLIPAIQSLVENTKPVIEAIVDFVVNKLIPAWVTFSEVALSKVLDFINWLLTDGIPAIRNFFQEVQKKGAEAVRWIQENIGPLITSIQDLVTAVTDRIRQVWEAMSPIFMGIATVIGGILLFIWGLIQRVLAFITDLWNSWGDNIWQIVQNIWNGIWGIIEGVIQAIRGLIDFVTGLISGDWEKAWNGIKDFFAGIWNGIWALVENVLGILRQIIGAAWDFIVAIFQSSWETITGIVSWLWEGIKGIFQAGYDFLTQTLPKKILEVVGWFQSLPDKILELMNGAKDWLFNIGRDILQGLWNGLMSIWDSIWSWIQEKIDSIPDFIKSALGIASPSKVMIEIGENTMKGLLVGLQSQSQAVDQFAQRQALALPAAGGTGPTYAPGPSGFGGAPVIHIEINLPGVTNAQEAQEAKQSLSEPSFLGKLTEAARAGVGQR